MKKVIFFFAMCTCFNVLNAQQSVTITDNGATGIFDIAQHWGAHAATVNTNDVVLATGCNTSGSLWLVSRKSSYGIRFATYANCSNAPVERMRIDGAGKVIIGNIDTWWPTVNSNYSLFVEKGIRTEEVRVDLKGSWPDYVFTSDYNRLSIEELEEYLTINQHLPNIPAATEIEEDGIDLGEMDAKLLEKIEEQALYIIELNTKLKAQQAENEEMKKRLEKLEAMLLQNEESSK